MRYLNPERELISAGIGAGPLPNPCFTGQISFVSVTPTWLDSGLLQQPILHYLESDWRSAIRLRRCARINLSRTTGVLIMQSHSVPWWVEKQVRLALTGSSLQWKLHLFDITPYPLGNRRRSISATAIPSPQFRCSSTSQSCSGYSYLGEILLLPPKLSCDNPGG